MILFNILGLILFTTILMTCVCKVFFSMFDIKITAVIDSEEDVIKGADNYVDFGGNEASEMSEEKLTEKINDLKKVPVPGITKGESLLLNIYRNRFEPDKIYLILDRASTGEIIKEINAKRGVYFTEGEKETDVNK